MTSDALTPSPSPTGRGEQDHRINFHDRLVVIATMHRKELAIAPILQTSLGVRVTVPQDFDSDLFGTFTRDIDRPANQVETAKLKAEKALELIDEGIEVPCCPSSRPRKQDNLARLGQPFLISD